jgi:hypothetical protein
MPEYRRMISIPDLVDRVAKVAVCFGHRREIARSTLCEKGDFDSRSTSPYNQTAKHTTKLPML